ncbi:glycosyltransferase [Streptomyces sp. NRRL S-350]|uniref:glycosyltransferase n=1 Tax=Streptomyces sp. NRRL S-350 TaxID=1463902 RepID=UPI0004BF865E|nr:glycosyltransferase [Streptomyces sp. NRRL S-350]
MTVPDVTVLVAVHDAVPYPTACPDSPVGPAPAPGRVEVAVVDDGSADGAGELPDEYAARHPGRFRVAHQPDSSGGPAEPTDRGLTPARGSVLADCDCCFLAPGADGDVGNPTERAGVLDRLNGIAALQQVASELVEPGEEWDAIRTRGFAWDVPRLLEGGFLLLDDVLQERVCVEVAGLVERFGVREVYHRLPVAARVRLELAVAVRPEALRDLIRYEAAHGEPPAVADGGRHYAAYPAFRDGRLGLPDELFLLPDEPADDHDQAPPLNTAQQLWRGVVPARVRRGLRRHPAWRRLANSVNGGRG